MKKLMSLTMALVLVVSLLALPASAKTTYTYKPYTVTDMYGDAYTFSAASTGYDLHSMMGDKQTRDTLVILKPGSTVTAKSGDDYGLGFLTWGIWGENKKGDCIGADEGVYETRLVESIYEQQCRIFNYDIDDTIASLVVGGKTVFFMLESAAERHSNMITREGEAAPVWNTGFTAARPNFYGAFSSDIGFFVEGAASNSTNSAVAGRWGIVSCYKDETGRYVPGDASIIEYTIPAYGRTEVGFHTTVTVAEYTLADVAELNNECRFIYVSLNAEDYNQ